MMEEANGHTEKSKSEYTCSTCYKKYSDEASFLEHENECRDKTETSEKFCKICKVSYNSISILRSHMKRKHEGKVFKCKLCNKEFNRQTDLTRHMNRGCNGKIDNLTCEVCEIKYTKRSNLVRHIKSAHIGTVTDSVQCSQCSKIFLTQSGLKMHKKYCEKTPALHCVEGKVFKCKLCNKEFNRQTDLTRHMNRGCNGKIDNLTCEVCEIKYTKRSNLVRHIKSAHIGTVTDSVQCSQCSKIFLTQSGLKMHKKYCEKTPALHCVEGKVFKCKLCNKEFNRQTDRTSHINRGCNGKIDNLTCEVCKIKYTKRSNLVRHIRSIHTGTVTDSVQCSQCSKIFLTKTGLKMHKKYCEKTPALHFVEGKVFKCKLCNKEFNRQTDLTSHINRGCNGKIDNLTCEVCGIRYTKRSNLVRHIRSIHTGTISDSVQCSQCSKIFLTKTGLKMHQKYCEKTPALQLVEGKVFKCKLCNKEFNRQTNLTSHINRGCNGKIDNHTCEVCEIKYTKRSNLVRHIRSVHTATVSDSVQCSKCSKICLTKTGLRMHKKYCEKRPAIHFCTECEIQFASRGSLRIHLQRKHKIKTEEIKKLDAVYDFKPRIQTFKANNEKDAGQTETDAAGFISVKVEKDANSESSEDGFKSNSQLQNENEVNVSNSLEGLDHENSETLAVAKENYKSNEEAESETVNLQCKECSRTFTSSRALCAHRPKHRTTRTCIVCNEVFKFGPDWTRHLEMHKNKERKFCHICGKSFATAFGLTRHMQKHDGVFFPCEICEKRFSSKQTLTGHMNVHKGVKPFICEICGERFRQRGHQIRHHRIHTGERKFKCDICPKAFIDSTGLKCHKRTHAHLSLRTYHTCNLCGKRLASFVIFKAHKRTHSLKRDFKCKLCEREFTAYNSLKDHMKRHERNQPASRPALFTKPTLFCDQCPKGFVTKRGLTRHRQKHAMGVFKRHNKYVRREDENEVVEAPKSNSRNSVNNSLDPVPLAVVSAEKDLYSLPDRPSLEENTDFYDQLRTPSQDPTGRDLNSWESIRFSKPRTVQSENAANMKRDLKYDDSSHKLDTKRNLNKLNTPANDIGLNLTQENSDDTINDDDDTIIGDGDMFNDDFIPNISETYKEVQQYSNNANGAHGSSGYNKTSMYGSAFKALALDKRNTNTDSCCSSHNNKNATYVFEVDDCSDCAVQCMRCSEMFYSPVLLMIHLKLRCIRRF